MDTAFDREAEFLRNGMLSVSGLVPFVLDQDLTMLNPKANYHRSTDRFHPCELIGSG